MSILYKETSDIPDFSGRKSGMSVALDAFAGGKIVVHRYRQGEWRCSVSTKLSTQIVLGSSFSVTRSTTAELSFAWSPTSSSS